MSQTIRIPTNLYKRLSLHSEGFESPATVIEKMINFYEEKIGVESTANIESTINAPTSLEIIYHPNDESSFKQALLQTKRAYILLYNVDGTTELKEWNATRFDSNSNVNGNLRSGYLRGWKNRGIFKAEISTNKNDLT